MAYTIFDNILFWKNSSFEWKKTRIKTTAEGKKSISESDLTIFEGQSFDVSWNSFTSTHIYHIARASSSRTPMLQFQ